MNRSSIALFLSTLALAGGTVACGRAPEAEQGDDWPGKEKLSQPATQPPAGEEGGEGGEGEQERERNEGGEGGEGGEG